ncbi:site-specific recombinase, DNA invertase Pin [Mycobacteroides abscessus subsp. massiliense]|uniref:recombinase family protein n=1 Tax=Mycobacteroides abscessus TaxID=36809 RepID=UPI0009A87F79|nr:recombinase family protein [Mycobacteroides abscessus]SLE61069.1 site-specific recombinase, DNA invertase Pin [Mycobacteroides abscessus subsp. massiliense]
MGVRAAIYVRISQDRDGTRLGVERQEQDCRKLANTLGLEVRNVFVDNDISAYSGKRRPKYEALLADIEAGALDVVLAWHPDRLHRSPLELETYIDLSERFAIQTHTVQAGAWDLSTPSGRAVARTLGAWARYESEHKGERIRRARQQQAKAGGWHGGIRPYGFEKDGVTIRPAEAAEIAKATEAIVSGVSLRSLVRDLNERGIPTATGRGPWTSVALKDTIMRPRTAGLSSYHGEVVGPAVWPPIVPEDTWRAACSILSDPARRTNAGRGGTVRWLGSGLYVCGVCGEAQLRVGTGGSVKRHTYRCGNRNIRDGGGHVTREAGSLDAYIEEVIVRRLSEPGLLDQFLSADPDQDTTTTRVELLAVRQRQDDLAGLFAAGQITARQLAISTEQLIAKEDQLAKTLASAGRRNPIQMLAGAKDLRSLWFGTDEDRSDGLTLGQRRALLDVLMTVTVLPAPRTRGGFDPDYVRIDWKAH